jgi:aldehyde dehydrogenase (NAD+)
LGGQVDENRGFEPTIVRDVDGDDVLMQEYVSGIQCIDILIPSLIHREIFGPILPIVPIADVADAIKFVNSRFVY